jgi:DNA-binding response OmpR family regulator
MHILVIDDHKIICENISLFLESRGHKVDVAHNGAAGFGLIMRGAYDFLIVDRMMPEIDGLSLIRMLLSRGKRIPFLFLTALSKQVDKIEWLSLGADDYLVKPVDLTELALRIENIMKRYNTGSDQGTIISSDTFTFWEISVDLRAKSVKKNWHPVELSPKEYHLLEVLIENRGKVLDRDFLYESVWWDFEVSETTLDTINVHIAHLRKKLAPEIIRTVKLSGYVIDKE